ncbi:MAG: ChuX/HutX family heme-like substrate-binding protein [Pseudomonadota bacterium]
MVQEQLSKEEVRSRWAEASGVRERDFAGNIGISEAEFVDAFTGFGNTRLRLDTSTFFERLRSVGEVMALSRNDAAVHEKTGVYEAFRSNPHASMVLGQDIDLRIFPEHWKSAFHVVKDLGNAGVQRSFQFFDEHGIAVHKVFERDATDNDAWNALLSSTSADDVDQDLHIVPEQTPKTHRPLLIDEREALRESWSRLEDTHQFQGMLRRHKVGRFEAIRDIGRDYARRLCDDALELVFTGASNEELPLMVFVRNRGILQIHSGTVSNIKRMGHWINVLDDGFHLHVRGDMIHSAWAVRKPTKGGIIWSLEAFDRHGRQIILINGYRREGDEHGSLKAWNKLLSLLPDYQHNTQTKEVA